MNALMSDTELHGPHRPAASQWQGFAEIDRAIAENRLTAYRWKKAWADPIARVGMLVGIALLLAYVAFVVWSDLL